MLVVLLSIKLFFLFFYYRVLSPLEQSLDNKIHFFALLFFFFKKKNRDIYQFGTTQHVIAQKEEEEKKVMCSHMMIISCGDMCRYINIIQ